MRVAVLRSLAGLVPNPLAHPLLGRLLPGLAPLLADAAAAVRIAVADLLLVVKCASLSSLEVQNPKQPAWLRCPTIMRLPPKYPQDNTTR